MPDLSSGQYSTNLLNQNFADIEAELLKTLYREFADGRNNAMEVDLDMASNRILNLPDAVQGSEPLTLSQATALTSGSNPVYAYYDNVAVWTRAPDSGSWTPGGDTQDIVVYFQRSSVTVSTVTLRGTLSTSTGTIAVTTLASTGEDTTTSITSNGTAHPVIIVTHDDSGVTSFPLFFAIQGGSAGSDGADGAAGTTPTSYYIKATNGTAIKNGVGTLTVEAHSLQGGVDNLISSGTPRLYVGSTLVTAANGYASGSDSYTGVFDSGDINDSVVVELKDSPTGTVYDSITLIDVEDGIASNATVGSISVSNGLAWTRAKNSGAWSPSNTNTDLTCTFYQGGSSIAEETRRVTLNTSDGTLTASLEGTDDANITVTTQNSGSTAITVIFTHTPSGVQVSETVNTSQSGDDGATGATGDPGADGDHGEIYVIRPTDGTAIKNGTGTLTIEARHITGSTNTLLSSGTIQLYDPSNNVINTANGYASGSDGYTGVFDSGDINGSLVVTLKDGTGGSPLDTITLVDVEDGVASNATSGSITSNNGLFWSRATNGGAWSPSTSTTDLTATFYQAGSAIATETSRVTRASDGTLTHTTTVNDANVTVNIIGASTTSMTIEFTHTPSGHVVSETVSTVQGGDDGLDGDSSELYYIKPVTGTAIKNGTGTITIEARHITGGTNSLLSSGTIQLYVGSTLVSVGNGYASGSNGYTGVFDSTDINDSVVVELKDGASGDPLDTITLIDVADGIGTDAVTGSIEPTNGLSWVRAPNSGAWTPTGTTTDLIAVFYQGGVEVARETRRVALNTSTGVLTTSLTGSNDPDVGVSVTNSGTSSVTVEFTHNPSGVVVSENVSAVQGGADGADGATGPQGPPGDNGTNGTSVVRVSDNIGINGDGGSVTINSAGGQLTLAINGSLVGFDTAQGPSSATLSILRGATVIAQQTYPLLWSFESEIGTWFWVGSNVGNIALTGLDTPSAGNVTYTASWSAGNTAPWSSNAASPILSVEAVQ